MKHRIFHHVRYERIPDWLLAGWIVPIPNGGTHHNHYGVMMEWICDCKMVRPG
jgi:hypothetical protein